MEIEKEAQKEIDRIDKIMENLELIDTKGKELHEVLNSYYTDAKTFYKKGQFLQALESAFIVWAYADAGLHLNVFKVSPELSKMFTV